MIHGTKIGADTWIWDKVYYKKWDRKFWLFPFRFLNENYRRLVYRVKHRTQRIRFGFSKYDAWGGDYYLTGIIASMAKFFHDKGHGYPANLPEEEWNNILERIYIPLEWYATNEEHFDREKLNEASQAMSLFAEHFMSFWD